MERTMVSVRALARALFAALLLAAAPGFAQVATSSFTARLGGSVSEAAPPLAAGRSRSLALQRTGPAAAEKVVFSGALKCRAVVVTDPGNGERTAMVYVDARGVTGKGASTGALYLNSGQANLTRKFVVRDQVKLTFAFFKSGPGGHLQPRTALATVNLTYDNATGALTGVSGFISSFQ
jgi:hypothetical protein